MTSTESSAGRRDQLHPTTGRRRRLRLPGRLARQFIVGAIAIGAFLVVATNSSTHHDQGLTENPPAPSGLAAAIDAISNPGRCLHALEAERLVRSRLAALALPGWTVARDIGVGDATCISLSIDTYVKHVILIQTMRPEVRAALDVFANTTYDECLSKDDANAGLKEVLQRFEEMGWQIRADGPVGGPLNQLDAIVQHVKEGCWIYAGTGWTDDGTRLYYIAGQRP